MDGLAILPFFGLNGPQFLLAYGIMAVGALIALWAYLRADTYAGVAPRIPASPDPYEIAYLRGGLREVAAIAVYSLNRQGAIHVDATSGVVTSAPGGGGSGNAVEGAVLRAVQEGMRLRVLANSAVLRRHVAEAMAPSIARMREQDLVKPAGAGARVLLPGLLVIGILNAYALARISYSVAHGHNNFGLLIAEAIIMTVVAIIICANAAQVVATGRGRDYLRQFKVAYSDYGSRSGNAGAPGVGGGSSAPLTLVAALGFGALVGTSDAAFASIYNRHLRPSGSGGDSNSSSCSSGGDSGGGGCGGCGGGGD